MPYKNIVFVKLLWRELLHENDKFTEQLNDDEKGLYLMLLLLAGATGNNIKNDVGYIKRTLNLRKNSQKLRENLDKILRVYPKCITKEGYIKFRNFKKIHNPLRKADGTPKDSPRLAKNRIDKIRLEYIKIKGFELKEFSSDDYARTAKAIKNLVIKAKNNDGLVIKSLEWADKQGWCDWTLETINKRWPDFIKKITPNFKYKPVNPNCAICDGTGFVWNESKSAMEICKCRQCSTFEQK